MQMCHSLMIRCKLLAENMESLGTSFLRTSKVESGHFGYCGSVFSVKVFKAVRGINFMAVAKYRSQQCSRRGQKILQVKVKK